MASSVIPFESLSKGEIRNIQRILNSRDGESIMKMFELTERNIIKALKTEREIPLYQAQGVARFLDDLELLMNTK